jgi:hypothetical protein
MSGVRRLFVGGPWHGQVHEMPDRRHAWKVPLGNGTPDYVTYQDQTFAAGFAGIRVMVIDGLSPYGEDVIGAIGCALALDVEVLTPTGGVLRAARAGGGE